MIRKVLQIRENDSQSNYIVMSSFQKSVRSVSFYQTLTMWISIAVYTSFGITKVFVPDN